MAPKRNTNPQQASPRERLIDENQAAAELGLSVKTLRRWRWMMIGPPWHHIGAAVRYSPADLDAFKAAGRVVPVVEDVPGARLLNRPPEAA
jgi:Helix-turn-helix domain